MAVTHRVKRGTAAQIASAAAANGLIEGELYLETDTGRLIAGLSTSTFARLATVDDTSAVNSRIYKAMADFLADATIPSSVSRVHIVGEYLADVHYEAASVLDYDVLANGRYWKAYGFLIDIRALGVVGGNTPSDGPKFMKAKYRVAVGGSLLLPPGQWYGPGLFERDDISIIGTAMPVLASDGRSYQNGSIILGAFQMSGHRSIARRFGVDAGANFRGSLPGTDAFVFAHANRMVDGSQLQNCYVDEVVGLCKDGTAGHGVLIEGHNRVTVGYVRGDFGLFGSVLKATNSWADHLDGFQSSTCCSIVKSDWYAPVANTKIGKMSGVGTNTTTAVVCIHAATASMTLVDIDTMSASGGLSNFIFISAPRAVDQNNPTPYNPATPSVAAEFPYCSISDCKIKTMLGVNAQLRAWDVSGAPIKMQIETVSIDSAVAPELVAFDPDVFGIEVNNLYASGPYFYEKAILLAGLFTVSSITCVISNNRGLPNGITLVPDNIIFRLDNYTGKINYACDATSLFNGWTSYGGLPLSGRFEGGKIHLSGRIVPPSPRGFGTNNTALRLPTGPAVDAKVPLLAYRAAPNPPMMVMGTFAAAGALVLDHFVTGLESYFPEDVEYVSLDGVVYEAGLANMAVPWLPIASGTLPAIAAGFDHSVEGGYWVNNRAAYSLPAWQYFAGGGSFTRETPATFHDYTGKIVTAAANVPRFDYDPETLKPRGLLLEGGIVNLAYGSGTNNSETWGTHASIASISKTHIAPDGSTNASLLTEALSAGEHYSGDLAFAVLVGEIYVYSVYVKAAPAGSVRNLYIRSATGRSTNEAFNPATGEWVSSQNAATLLRGFEKLQNGWYRVWIAFSIATAGSNVFRTQLHNGSSSYTGDGSSGLVVWGRQIEKVTVARPPSSYMPALTGTGIRGAEQCNINISSLNPSEGTIVCRFKPRAYDGVPFALINSSGLTQGSIYAHLSAGNSLAVNSYKDGVAQATINLGASGFGQSERIAVAYRAGAYRVCRNGGAVSGNSPSFAVPNFGTLRLGTQHGGANPMFGWLEGIGALTRFTADSEMQRLTKRKS